MTLESTGILFRNVLYFGFIDFCGARRFCGIVFHFDDISYADVMECSGIFFQQDAHPLFRYIPNPKLINKPVRADSELHTMILIYRFPVLGPSAQFLLLFFFTLHFPLSFSNQYKPITPEAYFF